MQSTTKNCSKCDTEKPVSEFDKQSSSKDKLKNMCKCCSLEERQLLDHPRQEEGTKICTNCDQEKDVNEFYSEKANADGLQSRCIDCVKDEIKKKAKENKKKNKELAEIVEVSDVVVEENKKYCTGCEKYHDITEFGRDNHKKGGYASYCKKVKNEYREKKKEENKRYKDVVDMVMKCTGKCGETKTLDKFDLAGSGKFGRHNKCKDCRSAENKELNYPRQETGTKICYGEECIGDDELGKEKDVSEFYSDKTAKDGLQTYCKDCQHVNTKAWASTFDGFIKKHFKDIVNNAKKRAKDLKVEITVDDIKELYIKQDGKCALSGIEMTMLSYVHKGNQHIMNRYNLSVDRINSSKDYTKDNIQLVCAFINRSKTDESVDQFLLMCNTIAKYNFDKINKIIIDQIKNEK